MSPAPLTSASTLSIVGEPLTAALGDGAIVLSPATGCYHEMTGAGVRIWALLAEGRPVTVRALRDAVTAEFDVDEATCERDVLAFVSTLLDEGLVKVVS